MVLRKVPKPHAHSIYRIVQIDLGSQRSIQDPGSRIPDRSRIPSDPIQTRSNNSEKSPKATSPAGGRTVGRFQSSPSPLGSLCALRNPLLSTSVFFISNLFLPFLLGERIVDSMFFKASTTFVVIIASIINCQVLQNPLELLS